MNASMPKRRVKHHRPGDRCETFEENFHSRSDVGAGFSAYVGGRKVVDLWGGVAKPGTPWVEDTLVLTFSVAKGLTAFVMQLLSDRGELDIEQPIAHYWPEFGKPIPPLKDDPYYENPKFKTSEPTMIFPDEKRNGDEPRKAGGGASLFQGYDSEIWKYARACCKVGES